ncbi:hypothetical protein SDC9_122055 [bioreactor metagenome]|uniref:Uncharacterized protein n=1 Tax=bioreactor metagenome TaxID=1076179 RepID=A0A645CDQ0_9ZZZZ
MSDDKPGLIQHIGAAAFADLNVGDGVAHKGGIQAKVNDRGHRSVLYDGGGDHAFHVPQDGVVIGLGEINAARQRLKKEFLLRDVPSGGKVIALQIDIAGAGVTVALLFVLQRLQTHGQRRAAGGEQTQPAGFQGHALCLSHRGGGQLGGDRHRFGHGSVERFDGAGIGIVNGNPAHGQHGNTQQHQTLKQQLCLDRLHPQFVLFHGNTSFQAMIHRCISTYLTRTLLKF